MASRRAVCNIHFLDLFTNWTQATRTNSLQYISASTTAVRAFKTSVPPREKPTNLFYNSKTLKQIHRITEDDTRYKILSFGTVRRVRELGINRKKYRLKPSKPPIIQQGSNSTNLIHIKPQQAKSSSTPLKPIKIATGNVQSLKNKEQPLLHQLIDKDIDIMIVTETWLTKDDTIWLEACDLNKDTYRIHSAHRQNGRGGGLALIHRTTNNTKLIAHGQTRSFEYATWQLTTKKNNITITGIYHPPPKNTITNSMFIDDITEHLITLLSTATNNIILGDFNMHINDVNSNDACTFVDTFTALGLTQHVTTSTHVKGNILDLVFTEESSNIKLTSCQAGPFLSDHKLVTAALNINRQPIEKKKLLVHKLHNITENNFKTAFDETAIDLTLPVDTVLHQLNNELHKVLDTIAPLKQIQVALHQKQPWFDEIVKARHKVVCNRERIWHKYPSPNTWKAYKVERNVYNRLLSYKKKQLITKQVIDCKGDNKKLYKLMAHLTGARSDNPLPPHDSDESLANQFADYFITKIDRIRDNFSQTPVLIPETTNIPTFQRFTPLTTEQVTNLISSMQTKSCELDPIPTHILK